jgi:hypothetical protein
MTIGSTSVTAAAVEKRAAPASTEAAAEAKVKDFMMLN